ncbi:MAG: response regulator [Pseudomonadota bacterium]|nr:response regulator [Pseudomonadota bacterium]
MKLAEDITAGSDIRKKIENMKKKRLVSKKIVALNDFRELKKTMQTRTILVVDDDETIRSALKRMLEHENYRVLLAEDGIALSKILESTRLDLILLDIKLPWVNGYELCRVIKSHHNLKNVPLIFVSACNAQDDIDKGYQSGCDDYVTKPFDIANITAKINTLLIG